MKHLEEATAADDDYFSKHFKFLTLSLFNNPSIF